VDRVTRRDFLALGGVMIAGSVLAPDSRPARNAEPALVDRVRVGCYVHLLDHPYSDPVPVAELAAFEAKFGRKFDIIHYYFGWGSEFNQALSPNVPSRDLMFSWKPDGPTVASIVTGDQDQYIDSFAHQAAAYGHPVFLRFAWEMNGSWMDYSSSANGPDATGYILAWQHVVSRFRMASASNVRFIWCPNEDDSPNVEGNHLENYWPGEDWVDILGFDGYNWSNQEPTRGDGSWRTFEQVCASPYARLADLSPDLPIWVCELGTTEADAGDPPGATKQRWFLDMFATQKYPRLQAVVYFSEDDTTSVRRDWRIDTSTPSTAGWKKGWRDAPYNRVWL
jgi:hypothetical protein